MIVSLLLTAFLKVSDFYIFNLKSLLLKVEGCGKPMTPPAPPNIEGKKHENTNYMKSLTGFYEAEPHSQPYMLR